jgi:hypothetical protein
MADVESLAAQAAARLSAMERVLDPAKAHSGSGPDPIQAKGQGQGQGPVAVKLPDILETIMRIPSLFDEFPLPFVIDRALLLLAACFVRRFVEEVACSWRARGVLYFLQAVC